MGVVGVSGSGSFSGLEGDTHHSLELVDMGHDLLTPTTTIIAYIEMLLEYAAQEATCCNYISDLNKMLVAGEQLSNLITQIFSNKDSPHGEIDREAFTSTIRHNLRTPINAIIGYGEMLLEDVNEQTHCEARSDLQKILTSARRLLILIGDLSYYSKFEEAGPQKKKLSQNRRLLLLP